MSSQKSVQFYYKILPTAPPSPLPAEFPLSALDHNDGFVHLSTAKQTSQTSDLFFSKATELWVVRLPASKFGDAVKWESGFPHLYGNFGAADVDSVEKFVRDQEQKWSEVMAGSSWLV